MALENIKHITKDGAPNHTVSKVINIDNWVFCYLSVSNTNLYTVNLISNKIIDQILENITDKDKNIYGNFSYSLDQVNMFISSLESEGSNLNNLNVIVWVREMNKFHFSKIGQASCYLYSKWIISELSHIPSKWDKKFSYISSGDLNHLDNIFISHSRLFDYFTKSDFIESAELESAEETWNNLQNILNLEDRSENIDFITIRFEDFTEIEDETETFKEKLKYLWLIFSDNIIVKKSIAHYLHIKEFFANQNKHIKTLFFLSWIIVCFFALYNLIWDVVDKSMQNQSIAKFELRLKEAEEYTKLAYQNINNEENFNFNISKAETLLQEIKENGLFIDDVNKMIANINIMKKDFNGIEVFSPKFAEKLFEWNLEDAVQIIHNEWSTYIIKKTSIIWPIINGESKWTYSQETLWDDEFIKASFDSTRKRIILLTKKSRVISYDLKWNFKYQKVVWQDSWIESNDLNVYNWNVYLLDKKQNQVYKHTPTSSGFATGIPYFKDEDVKKYDQFKINSIEIDGWIYLLRDDLVLEKFFSTPYTIQWIRLNNLPKNYNFKSDIKKSKLIARNDLNYAYMFFDNTIFIMKPNSKRYQDVKSFQFVWQIEWANEPIKDIYVSSDNVTGEIFVVYSSGIYKLKFDVTEDWITIL